jgi:hypothetical protein
MGIRKFSVGVVAFILLIWGPIDQSWPFWLAIRLLYLIAVPTTVWFVLSWIWRVWQPDGAAEDRLMRTVAGAVAGVLFFGAILAAQRKHHFECTQEVQNWDGRECVGAFQLVPGPDAGGAILLAGAGALALWFGVNASEDRRCPRVDGD